jgi:hypothetical protein
MVREQVGTGLPRDLLDIQMENVINIPMENGNHIQKILLNRNLPLNRNLLLL